MNSTPLAKLVGLVSAVALLAGLTGHAGVLGMAAVALIALLAVLGLRAPGGPSRRTLAAVAVFGMLFCSLLALGFLLHDPDGQLVTIGGLPAGTAMLVYGIAPLGISLGVLYGLVFDREILPREKLLDFLERRRRK